MMLGSEGTEIEVGLDHSGIVRVGKKAHRVT